MFQHHLLGLRPESQVSAEITIGFRIRVAEWPESCPVNSRGAGVCVVGSEVTWNIGGHIAAVCCCGVAIAAEANGTYKRVRASAAFSRAMVVNRGVSRCGLPDLGVTLR